MELTQQIKAFWEKEKNRIEVFGITILAGYLVHLYMFTNKFFNYFEMNNILNPMSIYKSDTLAMGRWFLPVLTKLSSSFSMPAVNGLIGVIFLAITNLLICDIMKLTSRFWCSMVGLLLVTFPSVASYYSYGMNSDVLCGTVFLATLGAWLVIYGKKEKNRNRRMVYVACGVVVIGTSVGAYQPFFSISVGLIFCVLFVNIIQYGVSWKETAKETLWYGVVLAAGFIFYYVCLQIFLKCTGVSLSDYHGVDTMTEFTVRGVVKGFVFSYLYFLRYLFTMEFANYSILIVGNIVLAIAFFGLIVRTHRGRVSQEGNIFVTIIVVALIPLGIVSAPFLMADRVGNGVDRYMIFSIVLLYVLFIKMASEQKGRHIVVQWGEILGLAIVILSGYYMCNQAYFRMESMTNQTDALFTRVIARMETTDGWNPDMPVYFANNRAIFSDALSVDIPEFDELTRIEGTELKPWYNRRAIAKYMRVYLHFPIEDASDEQAQRLEQSDELRVMPQFPAEESIQIIDGVMVVKLGEE